MEKIRQAGMGARAAAALVAMLVIAPPVDLTTPLVHATSFLSLLSWGT